MNNLLNIGWRNNRVFTGITILLILLTAFVSIFLSLMIAQKQAISKETKHLREVTTGVLMRMDATRTQLTNVVNHFASVPEKEACSPRHIQKMQEFNITGFFLQAVAHVKDNRITCSSISEIFDGLVLGQPFRIEPDGTRMWVNIKVADWQNHHLVMMEKAGWAIVLVPSHTIEALGSSDVSVGIFGIESQKLYTSRGHIATDWLKRYQGKQALTFIDKQRHMLVYMASNKLNLTGVVTAIPLEDINDDLTSFIQILIPLVIVVGISLGGIFVYMQKTRYSTKSAILRALANNEFYLEYQPIIHLETNHCVGAEALIRWRTSDNHFISPDTFIPAAEASGVICQITQRVFELVAKDMYTALNMHKHFYVGINISSQDIRSGALLPMIEHLKKSTGAQGNQLLIEVTERGFLDDEEALTTIKNIRECGVMVAIDDFGTGYSSLSYLTKFQLDYLKIDKIFVDSVGTDAVTSHVAFHIIEMAKTLQLGMVAEGVETAQQAKILQARGVKYVQGWLFSKSLKRKDFYNYLEKHT
ncbi:MAG TPA: EAL domain-containing protein [Methylophilus sp.]|uniref:EAL domain-containing protein n=1 Tax=Methylophilus sp. TaxID=29541 RepID=UPI002BA7A3FA|nr:EAL domain-containing protein [Methylophilus sp.]HSH86425.1 EAL domain-containing protein [Methylophilus sp.]